jgi:hypothetical protein
MYFNNSDVGIGFIWSGGRSKEVIGYLANYYPYSPASSRILDFFLKFFSHLFSHMRVYLVDGIRVFSFIPSVPSGWHILEIRTNSTHIEVLRDNWKYCIIKDKNIEIFEGIGFRQKSRKSAVADWWFLRKFNYPEPSVRIEK